MATFAKNESKVRLLFNILSYACLLILCSYDWNNNTQDHNTGRW